jgi:hypothetical protein
MKTIFLAWAKTARRSATLAEFFQARLIILSALGGTRKKLFPRLSSYVVLGIKTFFILLKERPKLIFIQCPPIQIFLPVYLYIKLYSGKYVIDAHSGAFIGKGFHFPIYLRFLKFFAQRAIITIIPNEGIIKYIANWQIPYYILEDGVPPSQFPIPNSRIPNSVVVICSFGADEPIQEIIEASKLLPEVQFYITGDVPKSASGGLKFTGFLKEKDYVDLIRQVDLVCVLTTRPDTILCGAYEGLALEKPLVLSDSETLRHHFPMGVVWVKNQSTAIAQGIKEGLLNLDQLKAEILQLKLQKIKDWEVRAKTLKEIIQSALNW